MTRFEVEISTMLYATVTVEAASRQAAIDAVMQGDSLPHHFVEASAVDDLTHVSVNFDNKGWEVNAVAGGDDDNPCPACADPEGPCEETCTDPGCDRPWDCCPHDACEPIRQSCGRGNHRVSDERDPDGRERCKVCDHPLAWMGPQSDDYGSTLIRGET